MNDSSKGMWAARLYCLHSAAEIGMINQAYADVFEHGLSPTFKVPQCSNKFVVLDEDQEHMDLSRLFS